MDVREGNIQILADEWLKYPGIPRAGESELIRMRVLEHVRSERVKSLCRVSFGMYYCVRYEPQLFDLRPRRERRDIDARTREPALEL